MDDASRAIVVQSRLSERVREAHVERLARAVRGDHGPAAEHAVSLALAGALASVLRRILGRTPAHAGHGARTRGSTAVLGARR